MEKYRKALEKTSKNTCLFKHWKVNFWLPTWCHHCDSCGQAKGQGILIKVHDYVNSMSEPCLFQVYTEYVSEIVTIYMYSINAYCS